MPQAEDKKLRYPQAPQLQTGTNISGVPQVQKRQQAAASLGMGSRQVLLGSGITPGQYNPVMENPALNMHGVNQPAPSAAGGQPDALGRLMNRGLSKIQPGQQVGPPVPAYPGSPQALLMDGSLGGRPVRGGQAAWGTPFALYGPQPASQPVINAAKASLASNPPMPAAMIGTDPNQINTTRNADGSTTFQTGVRGQDGFGHAKTSPNFREALAARQQLAGGPQQRPRQGQQPSRGVDLPQPPRGSGRQQRRDRGEAPRPMTLEERKKAGIGWKTAREHLSGAWRDYTSEGGNISAEGINAGRNAASLAERQMAEAGANQRAGEALAAGGDGRALDNEAKRMQNQQSQMEMAAREQLANSEQGSPEYQQAMARLKALRTSGDPEKLNAQVIDGPNPNDPAGGTMKVPAIFNSDGTYTLMQQTGQEGERAFVAELNSDPKVRAAWDKLNPQEQTARKKEWYRLNGFSQ